MTDAGGGAGAGVGAAGEEGNAGQMARPRARAARGAPRSLLSFRGGSSQGLGRGDLTEGRRLVEGPCETLQGSWPASWCSPLRAAAAGHRPAWSPASPSRKGPVRPRWRRWESSGTSSGASRSRPSPGPPASRCRRPSRRRGRRGAGARSRWRMRASGRRGKPPRRRSCSGWRWLRERAPTRSARRCAEPRPLAPGSRRGAHSAARSGRARRGRRAGSRSRLPRRASRTQRSSGTSSRPIRGSGISRWESSPTGRTRPPYPGSWRGSRIPTRVSPAARSGPWRRSGIPGASAPSSSSPGGGRGPSWRRWRERWETSAVPRRRPTSRPWPPAIRTPSSRRPPATRSGTPGERRAPAKGESGAR